MKCRLSQPRADLSIARNASPTTGDHGFKFNHSFFGVCCNPGHEAHLRYDHTTTIYPFASNTLRTRKIWTIKKRILMGKERDSSIRRGMSCAYSMYRVREKLDYVTTPVEHTTHRRSIMMKNSEKPTVIGTRSGYVIRFTCPSCSKENSIVYNMPKAFYKESRDATCGKCRKHFTVLTPH